MKLYVRTPAGTGLGIDIFLTGQVQEDGGKISRVEITLPTGCDHIVGYGLSPLPKSPAGDQLLWADPGDICAADGSPVTQAELRAEAVRVNELIERRMRDRLGENWP